jgi:hypothetical protein
MTRSKARLLALLCSFGIYLLPLLAPHGPFLVLNLVWAPRGPSEAARAFGNLAAAIGLQAAAFALFYWLWRRLTWLSFAAVFVGSVATMVFAQFVFLYWLPAMFLIEAETAEETGTWPEACSVADASVMPWSTPRHLPVNGWSEAWLADSQNRQWMLRMPDCQRIAAPLPQPHVEPNGRVDFVAGIIQVVPGGLALVQRWDNSTRKQSWHLLDTATATLKALPSPDLQDGTAPVLSDDGSRTAWIVPISGSGPPVLHALRVLPLEPGAREQALDLSRFGPGNYQVVGLDAATDEVLLWATVPSRLLRVGMDGVEQPGPVVPAGVEPQAHNLLLTAHGVVAWDAYQDDDNYAVAWSLDTGSGRHEIPRGSSIVGASADPSGRYVAVSTTSSLNIGRVKDSVFVLSAVDGREVFRRFISRYSRTSVVFLGGEYFVYSDASTTHVLRVPSP